MNKNFLFIFFFGLFILLSYYTKLYTQSIAYLHKNGSTAQLMKIDFGKKNERRSGPVGKAHRDSGWRLEYSESEIVSI